MKLTAFICLVSVNLCLSAATRMHRTESTSQYPAGVLAGKAITSMKYVGSTPADPLVRDFLGINLSDSIDFIRWQLVLDEDKYRLQCQYGLSKPNTNGFINGGKQVQLEGALTQSNKRVILHRGEKTLQMTVFDANLLHIVGSEGSALAGNDGWNYTLSNQSPSKYSSSYDAAALNIKDSARFVGRTPCFPPDVKKQHDDCYKLKWILILYAQKPVGSTGKFQLRGSVTNHLYKEGNYTLIKSNTAGNTYDVQLNGEHYYVKALDSTVIAFTNAEGNLLVGNGDFSFTLNRTR